MRVLLRWLRPSWRLRYTSFLFRLLVRINHRTSSANEAIVPNRELDPQAFLKHQQYLRFLRLLVLVLIVLGYIDKALPDVLAKESLLPNIGVGLIIVCHSGLRMH